MIRTSREQLMSLFESLEIPKNQIVMLHSALFSLGLIEGGVKGFYDTLRSHIGEEGTLIVPTFSYSFRRNEVFDIKNTPSAKNIGIFSEFVRNRSDAIRSADPLFSMTAVGCRSRELMRRTSKACFGSESIYARLFDLNTYFVAIGITYSTGLSGFIHLEKLAQVPYRKDIELQGFSRDADGVEFCDSAIHFGRHEEIYGEARTNREKMGLILEEKNAAKAVSYGYGRHLCLKGFIWRDIILDELTSNPLSMLDPTQYTAGKIPS